MKARYGEVTEDCESREGKNRGESQKVPTTPDSHAGNVMSREAAAKANEISEDCRKIG